MIKKVYEEIKKTLKKDYKMFIAFVVIFVLCIIELPFYIEAPGGVIKVDDRIKINDSYNSNLRAIIEQELGQYAGAELANIQQGMEAQKQEAMNLYLSGLQGY